MEPETTGSNDTPAPGISPGAPAAAQAAADAPAPATPNTAPAVAAPLPSIAQQPTGTPPHIHTESTLAPTSEFMRYVLAAWSSRYLFRGAFGTIFSVPEQIGEKALFGKSQGWMARQMAKPGNWLQNTFPHSTASHKMALAYNAALGLGSLALTLSYSGMVYKDIKNIFCEAVGEEFDKRPEDVTWRDINRSQNKIVKQTINNFWGKLLERVGVDLMFIPAAISRSLGAGDFVLGLKGGMLFAETWKRKTTMFEDLVTFINNKINPRNGLGQPISQGEVFDLFQHYNQQFHPEMMFNNVLEHGTGEGAIWATSQPIFQRVAELMNHTYAYKHLSQIDPATGHAHPQANFALPKLIYLMGHDLINTHEPERTMANIEIANSFGIAAVKEANRMWGQGASMEQVLKRYPVKIDLPKGKLEEGQDNNGVIIKGSSMQLDAVPSRIDASTIADYVAPTNSLLVSQV